ncbi:MAG: hypothetical protein Q7S53_00640 [bacterium]|nr:hypothetical protein [bacterium]
MKKVIFGFGLGIGFACLLAYKLGEFLFGSGLESILENMERGVKATRELHEELQDMTIKLAEERQGLIEKDV